MIFEHVQQYKHARKGMPVKHTYSTGDAARELGLPASTLRFYDKKGLLPQIRRTEGGIRIFTDDDLEWARLIELLKLSGMPIREIKGYIDLLLEGDDTVEQRRQIVYARRDEIDRQLAALELSRDFIEYKCWFYDKAEELGSTEAVQALAPEQVPPHIQDIKKKCRINRY